MKFKRRKTVAQKKLEDEKQNLVRVTDILAELEKQVGPLEKQSETAKEYLRLKEELKRCDANAFLAETAGIQTQLKELEEKEAIVSDQLEETSLASENLKREYDQLTEAIAALDEGAGREAGGADPGGDAHGQPGGPDRRPEGADQHGADERGAHRLPPVLHRRGAGGEEPPDDRIRAGAG